jgi:hypothetical protein
MKKIAFSLLALCAIYFAGAPSFAQDATVELAGGKLTIKAPAAWKTKKPASSIVEKEFSIPSSDGDGRCTIMNATGSFQANADRWIGQVEQPDGSSSKEKAKTDKKMVGEIELQTFDLSGTYLDSRGPMTPVTKKEKYRVMVGVLNTKKSGSYFIKFYGPEKLVADNEKAFNAMLESAVEK